MKINRNELTKIPYLKAEVLGDRVPALLPFWDGNEWHMWVPHESGLMKMVAVDSTHSDYVAREPAKTSDWFISFVNFMWQRAGWNENAAQIAAIQDDFHCLAASVAKIRHFHRTREMLGDGIAASLAATEIEYITIVARSVFDLLQEGLAATWNGRVKLLDEGKNKSRKPLPREFRKVIFEGETERTAEQISARFGLPLIVSSEYLKIAPFFMSLRSQRDRIIHGIGKGPLLFCTEKGFCVLNNAKPYAPENPSREQRYNENIVSIHPWIAGVITQTISACNSLVESYSKQIQFPPEIAPGFRVFVRGWNGEALTEFLDDNFNQHPWWR